MKNKYIKRKIKKKNEKKKTKKNTRHFELHSGKGDGRTSGNFAVENGNCSVGLKESMSNELRCKLSW